MRSLRRTTASLHRWSGLAIGLLLAWVAITGALLAYRPKLDVPAAGALVRATTCDEDRPLDDLVAAARQAHPAGKLDLVRVFAAGGDGTRQAAQVRLRGQDFTDTIYVDACDARVLGSRPRFGGVFGTIEQFHRFRFGAWIEWLPGVLALALIVMVAVGIYLWWPIGGRTLKRSIRFDSRLPKRARMLDRHRIVGLYGGAIVVLSALTGLPQAYDWAAAGVHRLAGSEAFPKKPASIALDAGAPLTLSQIHRQAIERLPDARDLSIRFGRTPKDAVEVVAIGKDAPHANARTMLYLDAYDGRTLRYVPYADAGAGEKLYLWTLSWHTGEIGGWVGPTVLVAGAASLLFLVYSGFSSWWRRRAAHP